MANVRDSDTSLWLHNKLGTSNDSWTGGSICSQLNAEVLRNIKDCFPDLQTQVKLKLLLSFFHIPRRNVEEWRVELEEILEVAQVDSEQWVSMLAEVMKTFPATGSLNTDICEIDENRRIFSDLVNDLKKLVKKQNDMSMLPLECHYLNKNVLGTVVGNQPSLIKHFTLKRKPKSAALRADLLQKSVDAANNLKKSTAPTIPVRSRGMPRKMTDTTPLKGIPSRVGAAGGFRPLGVTTSSLSRPAMPRTPAGRKDGGIKLLDITEQPLGYAQAKKRKRMQELEEASKKAAAAEALQAASATPDYAVGLIPSTLPTPASTPTIFTPSTPNPGTTALNNSIVPIAGESLLLLNPPVTPQIKSTSSFVSVSTITKTSLLNTSASSTPTVISVTKSATTPTAAQVVEVKQVPQVTQIKIHSAPPGAGGAVVTNKTGLSLTREQMLEAQIMFRTANKVTRPEKALILGFMAGSRDNPCPDLGNIVTIKLSENQENVPQQDENNSYIPMMAETHFQMNYNTGEWKRIKKFRKMEDAPTTQIVVKQPASSTQVPISPT